MPAEDPHILSVNARATALMVARITFGVGILFFLSFAGVALAILALHFGNLPTANERWMVAGFLAVLAILSLLVSRAAKSRITALK